MAGSEPMGTPLGPQSLLDKLLPDAARERLCGEPADDDADDDVRDASLAAPEPARDVAGDVAVKCAASACSVVNW